MAARTKQTKTPKPELSDIGQIEDVCPYCEQQLLKRPERKASCPHCRSAIFVRIRPFDQRRVLLTEEQARQVEAE